VRRVAFLALALLLALAPPAGAHGGGEANHADTAQELAGIDVAAIARTAQKAAEPDVAAADEALPLTWCGTETAVDDTANAKFASTARQIHVVYARTADRPNNFSQWKNRLQGTVSVVQRFLASQSGGTKALRFDMGTSCGQEYVDISSIVLPGVKTDYYDDLDAVRDATWAQLGLAPERDVIILADGLTANPSNWLSGIGEMWMDETPSAANDNNGGGNTSVLWAPVGSPGNWSDSTVWWPTGFLHELTHNIGGVQDGAPNSTHAGHCVDEEDVMCYVDTSGRPMNQVCPSIAGTIPEAYDCNKDDYFSTQPSGYLATAWNVYNSAFMASCSEVAPACGGAGGPTPTPPVNVVAPAVSGTARVGDVLTAGPGQWANSPTSFDYQWQRESTFGWSNLGANAPTYAPRSADVGLRLRVVVTARNSDGAAVVASGATASVAPAPTPIATPTPSPAPRVTAASAWLTVTAGSPRGKRLGRVAFSAPGAGAVKTRSLRIARPTGRYAAELCAAPDNAAVPACTVKRLRARGGRLTLPALTARLGAGQRVRVTLAVRSLTRRATAATRGSVPLDV
jgi:hypothetical protein